MSRPPLRLPQFGATTTIPASTRLVVLDCYETLVEFRVDRYVARRGIPRLLAHFIDERSLPVMVMSDAAQAEVEAAVAASGQAARIAWILGAPASLAEVGTRRLKRLDLAAMLYDVPLAEILFIGDSPLDAMAAQHHGVPFIRVPRSEDRGFSFAQLIHGPSRYDSQDFAEVMQTSYRTGSADG